MNELYFYKSFCFNLISFNKYHFTDHSEIPAQYHYFGCLIKGTANIKAQKTELILNPNEIFYIPKGLKYQSHWYCDDKSEILLYSFGFTTLPSKDSFELQKIDCSEKGRQIFSELCKPVSVSEKSIGALYYFFGEEVGKMKRDTEHRTNPAIEKITAYLRENPNTKTSEIAQKCAISESGIYSLFKRKLNKTPNEFRQKILCEKAVTLLTTTDKSVQEISDMLEFSSTSYFRKILKKHLGKTPLQIRKESLF